MKRVSRSIVTTGIAALAAASLAQVSPQNDGYLFRLKLQTGQKIHFLIPFDVQGLPEKPSLHLQFGMKLTVVRVRNGKSTIKVGKLETGSLVLPGFEKGGKTFDVDRRGHLSGSAPSLTGFCVQYPEDPLKVGESFSAPVSVPGGGSLGGGVDTAKATFVFQGFTGTGTKKDAVLKFKVAGNRAPAGTIFVRMTDGVIDKYVTKFYATPPGAGPNDKPLTISATILRS